MVKIFSSWSSGREDMGSFSSLLGEDTVLLVCITYSCFKADFPGASLLLFLSGKNAQYYHNENTLK